MIPETRLLLSGRVRAWIERDGGDHALQLITVDDRLRPHVMLLSRDEIEVVSDSALRVRVQERSATAENVRRRSSATIALYDAGLACTIKTRWNGSPESTEAGASTFELTVEEMRLDAPLDSEGPARLVSGLRFERRGTGV